MTDTKKIIEQNRKKELKHYGRLGMKWGKHIYGDYNDTSITGKNAVKNRKKLLKKRRSMSDEDIKKTIDRLKLEDTLKRSIDNDVRGRTTNVKKQYKKAYTEASRRVLTTAITGALITALVAGLKKTNIDSLGKVADYVTKH